jgi:hypothetical protein
MGAAADAQPIVHLGYLSPGTKYVGIEESATKVTSFVRDAVVGGQPSGSTTINGQVWQRYVSPDGTQKSLVQSSSDVTYVVNGQADWPDIEAFVKSLSS